MKQKRVPIAEVYLHHILPAVGGMLGTSLYVLGDTMLVGRRLGAMGLAALNISIPMINVLNGFGLLLGVGGASLFSNLMGKRDPKTAREFFTKSMMAATGVGLLLLVLSRWFTDRLVVWLGGTDAIYDLSFDYLSTLLVFSPFFLIFAGLTIFVRNDGGAKLAMTAMLSASVFNVVMDYVFLFPLDRGMQGCALATGLAPIVGIAILSLHFLSKDNELLFRFRGRHLGEIARIGAPSLVLEWSQGLVIFLFNLAFLRLGGETAVSAYGIVANLSLLFTAFLAGIAHGIQPLLSKSHGLGDEGAKIYYGRLAAKGALIAGVAVTVIGWAIPTTLSHIFIEGSPDVVAQSVRGIRLYFPAFMILGVNLVVTTFLQCQKMAKEAFFLSLMRGIVLVVILLAGLSRLGGVVGVWLVMPFTELFSFGIAFAKWIPVSQRRMLPFFFSTRASEM